MTQQTCETCDQPTAGARLCDRCTKTLAYAIANIAIYHADTLTVRTKRTRYSDTGPTKGSTGKSQPLPVDLRFVDAGPAPDDDKSRRPRPATIAPGTQLRWDTWQTVTIWAATVAAGVPPVDDHDEPACDEPCLHTRCAEIRRRRLPANPNVITMCHYLARMFPWIIRQTWVPVMLDELTDLERRLRRLVDRRPDRWYAGRCGTRNLIDDTHCTAELYAEIGRTTIKCPRCKTTHDVAARRDFLLTEARDVLVTATEAAGALIAWTDYDGTERNLIGRISKWNERKLITARGTEQIKGRTCNLYRLGDLQDRLVDDAQREQTRRLTIPG